MKFLIIFSYLSGLFSWFSTSDSIRRPGKQSEWWLIQFFRRVVTRAKKRKKFEKKNSKKNVIKCHKLISSFKKARHTLPRFLIIHEIYVISLFFTKFWEKNRFFMIWFMFLVEAWATVRSAGYEYLSRYWKVDSLSKSKE